MISYVELAEIEHWVPGFGGRINAIQRDETRSPEQRIAAISSLWDGTPLMVSGFVFLPPLDRTESILYFDPAGHFGIGHPEDVLVLAGVAVPKYLQREDPPDRSLDRTSRATSPWRPEYPPTGLGGHPADVRVRIDDNGNVTEEN